MATQHEKMQTDYLWLRQNNQADADPKTRTFGQNYLYYHAPNKRERLEMIWRSLGKAYDWELEKFRMAKKAIDRGNKRRFVKNAFRFFKNPIGYTYWRTFNFRQAKGRIIVTFLGFNALAAFWAYKKHSWQNQKKVLYLVKNGQNVHGIDNIHQGHGSDRWARQQMPLTQLLYTELYARDIIVSPSRDQNYRKYFEMRKKYGINE